MFEYRVTKYDPAHRDDSGGYTRDEWISINDIGQSFDGVVLTETEYQRVEEAYVTAAVAFLREAGVAELSVAGIENHAATTPMFSEGATLGMAELGKVIRAMLREEFWCRLEGARAFIHVGYDYYMYVGVPIECQESTSLASRLGLFVEPFKSPYTE